MDISLHIYSSSGLWDSLKTNSAQFNERTTSKQLLMKLFFIVYHDLSYKFTVLRKNITARANKIGNSQSTLGHTVTNVYFYDKGMKAKFFLCLIS
jgi:hypothetical protein